MEREKILPVEQATNGVMNLLKKPPKIRSVFGKIHEAKINLQIYHSAHDVMLSALSGKKTGDNAVKTGFLQAVREEKTAKEIEKTYDGKLRKLIIEKSIPINLHHDDYWKTVHKYNVKIRQRAKEFILGRSNLKETEEYVRGYFEELHRTGKIIREDAVQRQRGFTP